jgi:hypothetical protein
MSPPLLMKQRYVIQNKKIKYVIQIKYARKTCMQYMREFKKERKQRKFNRITALSDLCNNADKFFFSFWKVRMNHHASDECQIFKDNRDLLTENEVTDILLALRLWLIKHKNPVMWEEINRMEAHLDKRIGTSVWKDRETNVINVSLLKQIIHIIRAHYMFINSIYYI